MINVSLIFALSLRFLYTTVVHGHDDPADFRAALWSYVGIWAHNAPLLTLTCLIVFSMSGFYSYGRAYQSRYKFLVIAQAVMHSYLLFAVLNYLVWDLLRIPAIPRVALGLAFVVNLIVVICSRTWSFLWDQVVQPERERSIRANGVPRSVLVIGGAGYIGSALLPKLLAKGYRVRVLDLYLYGKGPIEQVANHPRLELMEGDFRHIDSVVEAMRGMDAVIHLGAIVGDPACDLDEETTIAVNLSATQMIAQVAKASNVKRFIFASTCSVYGACDEILDERSEVKPISLYGTTKLTAERGLQKMADENFAPTILRFATIYGLSGRTRFDLVVNLLAAKAKTEGVITVHGGDQWRPFVHVDDAALAVFKVLEAPITLVGNQIFNVGTDKQNFTINQIGELIHQSVVGSQMVVDSTNGDRRNYRVSFQKIQRMLGFHPQWTVKQGIEQVVEAVAAGEVQDYRDPQYSNVKVLKESGLIEIIREEYVDWARDLRKGQPVAGAPVAAGN
jgi:nucleoside-diphosphate-sugar epimerase